MLKVLNAGKYDEVPYQMKRWNRAGGKVLKGLVVRRKAEAELFNNESD
jgi:lysozyme